MINFATIIVILLVAAAVALALRKVIRGRKKGKLSSCLDCKTCPFANRCPEKERLDKN